MSSLVFVVVIIIIILLLTLHSCESRCLLGPNQIKDAKELEGQKALDPTGEVVRGGDRSMKAEIDVDGREDAQVAAGAVGRRKSPARVSWHVPHERNQEYPEFNFDYVAPKTHPPSHNRKRL